MFFAAFFDLTLHYVGPFPDAAACDAHASACRAAGDGADYRGAVPVAGADPSVDIASPESDLDLIRSMSDPV